MQCLSRLSAFPTGWTVFGWGSQKGSDFFFLRFFFFLKRQLWEKKRLLVECCGQTKQKTEKFTVHRCTHFSFSPRTWAKESWLTVDYGYQGALVFRQGQTITLFLRGQFLTQPWFWACACVCEGVCVSPAGDFICSHSLDLCRWTKTKN